MGEKLNNATMDLLYGAADTEEKLERIYYFVRDQIQFDLVADQFMSSDDILDIGRGACMSKALLFHDMVQKAGIPVRLHFMEVSKKALEDLLHPIAYRLWPSFFLHTFPEVKIGEKWVPIEPTFDKNLHEILLKKRLNFAKYEDRRSTSICFNINGVHGAQQQTLRPESSAVYANDLGPLRESVEHLPDWKLRLQPFFYNLSSQWLNRRVRKE